MAQKNLIESFYDVLGVSQTASTDEITDAEVALRKVYEARSKQGLGDDDGEGPPPPAPPPTDGEKAARAPESDRDHEREDDREDERRRAREEILGDPKNRMALRIFEGILQKLELIDHQLQGMTRV